MHNTNKMKKVIIIIVHVIKNKYHATLHTNEIKMKIHDTPITYVNHIFMLVSILTFFFKFFMIFVIHFTLTKDKTNFNI